MDIAGLQSLRMLRGDDLFACLSRLPWLVASFFHLQGQQCWPSPHCRSPLPRLRTTVRLGPDDLG